MWSPQTVEPQSIQTKSDELKGEINPQLHLGN